MIDGIGRFGLGYHFENEIRSALDTIASCVDDGLEGLYGRALKVQGPQTVWIRGLPRYYITSLSMQSATAWESPYSVCFIGKVFGIIRGMMEDPKSPGNERSSTPEPVRSRWTPKLEQILILESIFNSGMVNPPKDESVRIRKMLEKFGAVGDANVFYWLRNRRLRSRRRQRQIQAANLANDGEQNPAAVGLQLSGGCGGAIPHQLSGGFGGSNSYMQYSPCLDLLSQSSCLVGSSSSAIGNDIGGGGVGGGEDLYTFPGQMDIPGIQQDSSSSMTSPIFSPSDASNLHFQSGFMTVFINGGATEVPKGPIDMKAMFGPDVILAHSSGMTVPFNEYGFLLQNLQPGENYFLVPKPT